MEPNSYAEWDDQQISRRASFLQSKIWGEFQGSIGHQPHYLMTDSWSCLLLERKTPFGNYLFAPYGPTLATAEAATVAVTELKHYGQKTGVDWLRLEPMLTGEENTDLQPLITELGCQKAPHNVEPALTRIIDLTPDIDDLLASISATTRTFIRKNQRENIISFKTSTDPADMPNFVRMVEAVTSRKNVHFFSEDYYLKQARALMPAGMMHLELAYEQNQPVGGIVMHDYGTTTSYTHAASLPQARKNNVSALLLWQAMVNAKARNMQTLDLYGVAPDDAPPSHPWYGFSTFKRKFGGQLVEHAGTWDIGLTSKYKFYRSARKAHSLLGRRR